MKNTILTILLFLYTVFISAQDYNIVWQQCLGDEYPTYNHSVTKLSDGFFLTLGINSDEVATNYHGSADIWVIRTDSLYNILWEKCYGGLDTDNPRKIIPITDSTFYIFGSTYSVDGDVHSDSYGYNSVWVVKINGQGDILWENTYGSPLYDEMNDLVLTPDGGFVFIDRIFSVGEDVSQYFGLNDVWMCKCDSEGNIEWEKTLGNEGMDNGVSLLINRRGNIVMVGAVQWHGGMITCQPQGELGNVWLVELDMQGNILWQECYGGSDYEAGIKIIEVGDGYIFTGVAYSNDGDVSGHHGPFGIDGKPDIWLVKTDTLGEIIWQNCLGGTQFDAPIGLSSINTGEILVFGYTKSNDGDVSANNSNPGNVDGWLAKLDANGVMLGQQCFGGRGSEYFNTHSVAKINDYRYLISSNTTHGSGDVLCTLPDTYDSDAWFFEIKDCDYYAPGIPAQPEGPADICTASTPQSTYTILSAANSNGYVWELMPLSAGTLSQNNNQTTISWDTTFKGTASLRVFNFNDCGSSAWSETLNIHVETCLGINEAKESFARIYPNPAGNYVVFELKKPILSGTITISDITGRQVASMPITGKKTIWQTGGVPSGVYLYRIGEATAVASGKLVILND